MASDEKNRESTLTERARLSLFTVAATAILAGGGWGVSVVQTLTTSVAGLKTSVEVLSMRVSNMPPPELLVRLAHVENEIDDEIKRTDLELRRQQQQIDVLEEWIRQNHPVSRRPPTREYAPE